MLTDHSTDTGKRVNLDLASMFRNAAGKPIDPRPSRRTLGGYRDKSRALEAVGLSEQDARAEPS